MSNLFTIKKKIASIKKINKITESMKIVAISKINKLKRQYLANSEYQKQLYDVVGALPYSYSVAKDKKKHMWVIFTSTLGMAGSYNINIFKKLKESINPGDTIVVFGLKGEKLLNRFKTEYHIKYFDIYEKEIMLFSFHYAATYICKLFSHNMFNGLTYIYTTHTNNLSVVSSTILPFPMKSKTTNSFLLEPGVRSIIDNTFKLYIESTLYSAYLEAKLCEQISRKTSMSHANDNINDMLSELGITYNKKRQEKITQEVARA
ncbi:MAG: F0F1 ATP synthase subunit gamma [Mycoplasmataceae bacterium]|jgi:F-type H+-transporting ATPase subunit gamma|nr:F0F1 ATP synthase subunit gamma [Mycoplasmataceae bacterium]